MGGYQEEQQHAQEPHRMTMPVAAEKQSMQPTNTAARNCHSGLKQTHAEDENATPIVTGSDRIAAKTSRSNSQRRCATSILELYRRAIVSALSQ
jgi:hypothetical protein